MVVCDNGSPSRCDTVNIIYTIVATNRQPIAVNDVNNTLTGIAVTGNVKVNDSDPDFNTLTVQTTPIDVPNNGTIVFNANGAYTYTPSAG